MAQILRDTDGNPLDKLENSDLGNAVIGTAKDNGSGDPVFSEMKLDRMVVDLSEGRPTPTEDQKFARGYDGRGNEYVVEPKDVPGTDADGTWSDYSNSNYEGVHAGNPYIRGATGHFYYNPNEHSFYESVSFAPYVKWRQVTPTTALGSNAVWLRELDSDTEASNAISTLDTTKTYHFYHNSEQKVKVLDNATYTAPVGPSQERVWSRVAKDEARRLSILENQALARHKIEINDFQIDGNASHAVRIDVSAIRAFLADNRAYGILRLTLKYQASHAEGSMITNLGPSGSYLINNSLSIGSTTEQSRNYAAVSLSSTSFGSDTIDLEIDINGTTTSGFNILLTDVEIEIINGYLPSQAQILSLLNMTTDELNNIFVNASIVGNNIVFVQNDGTNIAIPRTTATTNVDVGNALPTSGRRLNDLYLFDAAATGLTNAVDTDGTTAKTTAQAFDLFRLTAVSPSYQWTYVGFVGDNADGVVSDVRINSHNELVIETTNGDTYSVDLDTLFHHVPVRQRVQQANIGSGGNAVYNRTVDVQELREFLGISDRAYGYIRAVLTFERTGDAVATGKDLQVQILDGTTEIAAYTESDVAEGTEISITLGGDVTALSNDTITIRFTPTGFAGTDNWIITNFDVDIIASFQDDDEADSYVTGITRNGTVLVFARNNSLSSLTVDLSDLFGDLPLHEIIEGDDLSITQNGQSTRNINIATLRRFLATHARSYGYLRASATYRRTGGGSPAGTIAGSIINGSTTLDSFNNSNVPGNTDVERVMDVNLESLAADTLEFGFTTTGTPTGDNWTITNIQLDVIVGFISPHEDEHGFITAISRDGREIQLERTDSKPDLTLDLAPLFDMPAHQLIEYENQRVANNTTLTFNIDATELREHLAGDARAFGVLRVSHRFRRDDANAGGSVQTRITNGGTNLINNNTLSVHNAFVTINQVIDLTSLSDDTLVFTLLGHQTIVPNTFWLIQDIEVQIYAGINTGTGVSDGVLQTVSRAGRTLTFTRSNSLPNLTVELPEVITPFANTELLGRWNKYAANATLANGHVLLGSDTITFADVDADTTDQDADINDLLIGRVLQLQRSIFSGGNDDTFARCRITSARTDITSPVNGSRYNIVWLWRDESYFADATGLEIHLVDHDVNLLARWMADSDQGLWNPVLIFDGSVTGTGTGTLSTGFEFNQFRWLVWAYHSTDTNNAGSGSVGIDEQRQKHLTFVNDFLSSKQTNPPSDTTLIAAFGVQLHARTRNCVVQRVWSSGVGSDNQFVITHQGVADGIEIDEIYGIY